MISDMHTVHRKDAASASTLVKGLLDEVFKGRFIAEEHRAHGFVVACKIPDSENRWMAPKPLARDVSPLKTTSGPN
jgi:hypothetical protein